MPTKIDPLMQTVADFQAIQRGDMPAVSNPFGSGGFAGSMARGSRPTLLQRLHTVLRRKAGNRIEYATQIIAARYAIKNKDRAAVTPALYRQALKTLAELVDDAVAPDQIALEAGILLERAAQRKRKGGADA